MRKIVLATIMLAFMASGCLAKDNSEQGQYNRKLSVIRGDTPVADLNVEVADTVEKRTIGLMFRKTMPENAGMLFLFEDESVRSFWMRNTLIPLDMIFINRAGVIVHIHENAKPHDESRVPSVHPVSQVLEINGGRAAELEIRPGDRIELENAVNSLADKPPIH